MLDVTKEIKAYDVIDLEQKVTLPHQELLETITTFTNAFKRIGKDQFKFSQQLEEIFFLLEEEQEQNKNYQKMEQKMEQTAKKGERDLEGLLQVLLTLADSLEDIYRYALSSEQPAWKEQMRLQWLKVEQQLEKCSITRIEGAGTLFAPQLHIAKEIKKYPGVPHGQILDLLRNGYMYKGKILRKAEVIVNQVER